MLDRLMRFTAALREAGVGVSPAEVADACRAALATGVNDREALRAALRATMVKSVSSRQAFDLLFEIFFPLAPLRADDRISDDELSEEVLAALIEEEEDRLPGLVGEAVERFAGISPGRPVSSAYYSYRTARAMDLDGLKRALVEALAETGDGPEVRREATRRMGQVSRLIDREVLSRLVAERGAEEMATALSIKLPEDVEIMHASSEELRSLRETVAPLAAKLVATLERRHRAKREGPLDFRATIRESLSTGGVPVNPITKRKRPERPEVVLITDISGSVASFARFTLQLLYTLSNELRGLRSFAFIDEVDEVTGVFNTGMDVEAVLREIAHSAKVVGTAGHSDYGSIFRSFDRRYSDSLGRRTTLIVCGDARSNYHDPGLDAFKRIAGSVKATYWLNPEPEGYWDTGDSMMAVFAPYCTAATEVRTLRQLHTFISEVL